MEHAPPALLFILISGRRKAAALTHLPSVQSAATSSASTCATAAQRTALLARARLIV